MRFYKKKHQKLKFEFYNIVNLGASDAKQMEHYKLTIIIYY